ncbi:hypothetical protein pneo_cds_1069 [Pandoravirus neocaledonia]|uniref:Ankyrin repeat domain containing protein n=1 Tax=Pandoravirus neocaledonia TaxID=2107708 RepID=A0A2U7UE14_9VIRU|nr:hypothetical protein pneo_cds_1069 [Pandoravirus neocaledonia]AVK76676.1 hypothetical protein pneo_cds_1069 [Pandoravirus neocaledonia]
MDVRGLPNEILYRIVGLVDDASFCAVRLAHRCFDVYDNQEITRMRKLPRWKQSDRGLLCRSGNLEAVSALCGDGALFSVDHLREAVLGGQLNILVQLHCHGVSPSLMSVNVLIGSRNGTHRDFWLYIKGNDTRWEEMRGCGHPGRPEPWTTTIARTAIECGHLDIVYFLHKTDAYPFPRDALEVALSRGHPHVASFLAAQGFGRRRAPLSPGSDFDSDGYRDLE